MSFFQNLFHEFNGYYLSGDSSGYKLTFKIPANANFSDPFINWTTGPFDFSTYDTLTFNYAFDPEFAAWQSFSVNVAGDDSSATTAQEVADLLNGDDAFSAWYVASVLKGVQVSIKQRRPLIAFKTYISNTGAEQVLKFNQKAGVAELPTYFQKSLIGQPNGQLLSLSVPFAGNSAATPTVITSLNHGLTNGDTIYIYSNSSPALDGEETVTVIDENSFSVNVAVSTAGTWGEYYTTADAAIVEAAGFDIAAVKKDWQLLAGRVPGFMFTKNTVDGSNRVTSQLTYPAGSTAGMVATKTFYTYSGGNTTPSTVAQIPYVLTDADLLVL
jgi:hypothetical protein